MNRNVLWKIVLILAVLVVFSVAIIPTKSNPEPIRRGLDLKGGIHLVMKVNVNEAVRLEVDQAMNSMRAQAGTQSIPVPATRRISDTAFLVTPPAGVATDAYERIGHDFLPTFEMTRVGADLRFTLKPTVVKDLSRDTVEQAVETIDRRVNALGVTEPIIVPEGEDRIVIQLPGVDDPARVKDIIKTTAQLQFRLVEGSQGPTAQAVFDSLTPAQRADSDILPGDREDEMGRKVGTEFYAVGKNVAGQRPRSEERARAEGTSRLAGHRLLAHAGRRSEVRTPHGSERRQAAGDRSRQQGRLRAEHPLADHG